MPTKQELLREIDGVKLAWSNDVARRGRFGNVIRRFQVSGVRGIDDLSLSFDWPVTVIAGANGSGKTTVLQLCSAAYQNPAGGGRNYRIGEWVRNIIGQQTPVVRAPAGVEFHFDAEDRTLVVPYVVGTTRWGYPRRGNPVRNVVFYGIGAFAPRIEKKDRLSVSGSHLRIRSTMPFGAATLQSISTILGVTYDGGCTHVVGTADTYWSDTVTEVRRGSHTYGEPHMGAGEQKVVRMVTAIEALPPRSLVLLEEPEITLHPDAQSGLAWYLMNVSKRMGHQILVTTHSTVIYDTLPQDARILLVKGGGSVRVIPHAPEIAAARELAGAVHKTGEMILVEDDVAKYLVQELLRRYDRDLLRAASVVVVGDTNQVRLLVAAFRSEGCRVVGVRDPDVGGSPESGLVSLPGHIAPEAQLLEEANLARAETYLHGVQAAHQVARRAGLAFTGSDQAKRVFAALAEEVSLSREALIDRLAAAWIDRHAVEAAEMVRQVDRLLHAERGARVPELPLPPTQAPMRAAWD